MRNFTFRAYDTKNKRWLCHYPEIGGFSLMGECVIFGEWAQQLGSIEGWNDIIIMQATGLKDKNGLPIYEGDVVKYIIEGDQETGAGEREYTEEVVFEEGCFNVEAAPLYVAVGTETCEVIGNIYEHPELLKQV